MFGHVYAVYWIQNGTVFGYHIIWYGKLGFHNFIIDMGLRPFKSATIDRVNNNGNYEPSNCQWLSNY